MCPKENVTVTTADVTQVFPGWHAPRSGALCACHPKMSHVWSAPRALWAGSRRRADGGCSTETKRRLVARAHAQRGPLASDGSHRVRALAGARCADVTLPLATSPRRPNGAKRLHELDEMASPQACQIREPETPFQPGSLSSYTVDRGPPAHVHLSRLFEPPAPPLPGMRPPPLSWLGCPPAAPTVRYLDTLQSASDGARYDDEPGGITRSRRALCVAVSLRSYRPAPARVTLCRPTWRHLTQPTLPPTVGCHTLP